VHVQTQAKVWGEESDKFVLGSVDLCLHPSYGTQDTHGRPGENAAWASTLWVVVCAPELSGRGGFYVNKGRNT